MRHGPSRLAHARGRRHPRLDRARGGPGLARRAHRAHARRHRRGGRRRQPGWAGRRDPAPRAQALAAARLGGHRRPVHRGPRGRRPAAAGRHRCPGARRDRGRRGRRRDRRAGDPDDPHRRPPPDEGRRATPGSDRQDGRGAGRDPRDRRRLRAVVGDFEFYTPLDRVEIPAAAPRPALWRAAIERVADRAGGRSRRVPASRLPPVERPLEARPAGRGRRLDERVVGRAGDGSRPLAGEPRHQLRARGSRPRRRGVRGGRRQRHRPGLVPRFARQCARSIAGSPHDAFVQSTTPVSRPRCHSVFQGWKSRCRNTPRPGAGRRGRRGTPRTRPRRSPCRR